MKWKLVLLTSALAVLGASQATAQARIVTGRVTDSLTSEPVTAGQVTVQGTTITTTVRDDGTFTIAVPQRDVLISIRSIGFKRRDIASRCLRIRCRPRWTGTSSSSKPSS